MYVYIYIYIYIYVPHEQRVDLPPLEALDLDEDGGQAALQGLDAAQEDVPRGHRKGGLANLRFLIVSSISLI